jgi:hypothetical protein
MIVLEGRGLSHAVNAKKSIAARAAVGRVFKNNAIIAVKSFSSPPFIISNPARCRIPKL